MCCTHIYYLYIRPTHTQTPPAAAAPVNCIDTTCGTNKSIIIVHNTNTRQYTKSSLIWNGRAGSFYFSFISIIRAVYSHLYILSPLCVVWKVSIFSGHTLGAFSRNTHFIHFSLFAFLLLLLLLYFAIHCIAYDPGGEGRLETKVSDVKKIVCRAVRHAYCICVHTQCVSAIWVYGVFVCFLKLPLARHGRHFINLFIIKLHTVLCTVYTMRHTHSHTSRAYAAKWHGTIVLIAFVWLNWIHRNSIRCVLCVLLLINWTVNNKCEIINCLCMAYESLNIYLNLMVFIFMGLVILHTHTLSRTQIFHSPRTTIASFWYNKLYRLWLKWNILCFLLATQNKMQQFWFTVNGDNCLGGYQTFPLWMA